MTAVQQDTLMNVPPESYVKARAQQNKETWHKIGELYMPNYQRLPSLSRVAEMREHFDIALLERLTCNRRPGGTHIYIVDGQHRYLMLWDMGWPEVPISLHHGWNEDQEREKFKYLNSGSARRPLSTYDIHHAGDEKAKAIDAAVAIQGFRVTSLWEATRNRKEQRSISAVRALETIYDAQPWGGDAAIQETLFTIKRTWNAEPGMLRTEFLLGVFVFLTYTRDDRAYLPDRFFHALRTYPPRNITQDAAMRSSTMPGQFKLPRMIAEVLAERYNYGLRGEKLLSHKQYRLERKGKG